MTEAYKGFEFPDEFCEMTLTDLEARLRFMGAQPSDVMQPLKGAKLGLRAIWESEDAYLLHLPSFDKAKLDQVNSALSLMVLGRKLRRKS